MVFLTITKISKQKHRESEKKSGGGKKKIEMALNTPIRSNTNTTPFSNSVFKSKHIFLHEWWLMKPQNQCNGLAIGGVASSMERDRVFLSTMIVKSHEPNVVETEDGITIIFSGFINASRTSQNGFPSEVCQRFLVGFPHDWESYSAHSSGNKCANVDRVTGLGDSNASSHKKTADETSQEAMEAEGNDNITSLRLSQPQVDVIHIGENEFPNVDDSNATSYKKVADETSQEAMEAESNDNIASLRLSQPRVDVVYNGENLVSDVDDFNASCHKNTAVVTSHAATVAEDNDNNRSLRLSQPVQVNVIYNGQNGFSSVAAAECSQSFKDVFELDSTPCTKLLEQSSVASPLYAKKLEFDQLSSDRKEEKRIKRKIVEDTGMLRSRVLTRSMTKKKSHNA